MNIKFLFGVASGMIIGGGITYATLNKKIKENSEEIERLSLEKSEMVEDHEKEIRQMVSERTELMSEIDVLRQSNMNAKELYSKTVDEYGELVDPNMLADTCNVCDAKYLDDILIAIRDASKTIRDISRCVDFTSFTSEDLIDKTKSISSAVSTALGIISTSLEEYQKTCDDEDEDIEDDEEDDTDDTPDIDGVLIYPENIIFNALDGSKKIFKADSIEGFELVPGSDPDNNEYLIYAQNIPALYDFMLQNIKEVQLKNHLVAQFDKDNFDELMDDLKIIVSLSFINDDSMDMVINNHTHAYVPFVYFSDHTDNGRVRIYTTDFDSENCEKVNQYFINKYNTENIKPSDPSDKIVKTDYDNTDISFDSVMSDEAQDFISTTTGINRNAVKAFIGNLTILYEINSEAADAIYGSYRQCVDDVLNQVRDGQLTEGAVSSIKSSIEAIMTNMKHNYGHVIKTRRQFNRESSNT